MVQKNIFNTLVNRHGMVADIESSQLENSWGISQEQFLRRVELVESNRDLAGVTIRNEVADILNTKGGKAGRFKW